MQSTMLRCKPVRPLALAAILALSACQNTTPTQRHTATGAAVGAVAGAGVAHATGGKAATGAVVGAAIGGTAGYLWSKNMERQKQELERSTQGTGIKVTRTDDNRLKLNLPADITFNSYSAVLRPQARTVLNSFANSLRRNPTAQVLIVGHADSSGNAASNETLSLQRANTTRSYIFSRKVQGPRIQTEGRGAREPIASNYTEAGRAQNRRVEIFVMESK
ncbi:MAG: OmpA family protein [Acidovorax sp.]|jgi:outer membrane protein OmpA-like peptidoglycan-associated protein|nr:OmpA family protein [Acidovorax sp.]